MKQNQFSTAIRLSLGTLLFAFVIASCTKKSSELNLASSTDEFASAKGKPGTTTEVRLKLTVNPVGNNITSNGGDYVDGTENTSIYFSTAGNLQFSTSASNNPNVPTTRWLNVDFSNPLPGYPARGIEKSNFISTITTLTSPDTTKLQNLTPGQTKCIGFSAGFMTIAYGVLNFHRNSTEDTPTTPTSYVYVTRLNPTQWLMTPSVPVSGGCSAISNVGALRINTVLFGYYNMPFSFTLTKL